MKSFFQVTISAIPNTESEANKKFQNLPHAFLESLYSDLATKNLAAKLFRHLF